MERGEQEPHQTVPAHLDRFTQAHFVRKDAIQAPIVHRDKPVNARSLVISQKMGPRKQKRQRNFPSHCDFTAQSRYLCAHNRIEYSHIIPLLQDL
jgi:hypothetical protein